MNLLKDFDDEFSDMLQKSVIEHDPGEAFDANVVNQVRLNYHARTFKFWAPALLGAFIAALGLLAAVEMVYFSPSVKPLNLKGHEARVTKSEPLIPDSIDSVTR